MPVPGSTPQGGQRLLQCGHSSLVPGRRRVGGRPGGRKGGPASWVFQVRAPPPGSPGYLALDSCSACFQPSTNSPAVNPSQSHPGTEEAKGRAGRLLAAGGEKAMRQAAGCKGSCARCRHSQSGKWRGLRRLEEGRRESSRGPRA